MRRREGTLGPVRERGVPCMISIQTIESVRSSIESTHQEEKKRGAGGGQNDDGMMHVPRDPKWPRSGSYLSPGV